jgi:2-polyprenyl-3-methyl-5-hydroxy-6-metoxy-1,4-benzoquinol methylase
MTNQNYGVKPQSYFTNARTEIEPMLPATPGRVLEVGCGQGSTLRWLKSTGRCTQATGLELFEDSAREAAKHIDRVVVGNAEQLVHTEFVNDTFDLVLCLDVLEHMVDPWAFVDAASKLIRPGGLLIASIPNVRHVTVVAPLLLQGRWSYGGTGVLDRTHLRFFTQQSAIALVDRKPLRMTQWAHNMPPPPSKSRALNRWTGGLFKDFLALQFLVAAECGPHKTP